MKKYEVAINKKGQASKCKLVDEQEYKRLLAESDRVDQQEQEEKLNLQGTIAKLFQEIDKLKHEIKVLKGEE